MVFAFTLLDEMPIRKPVSPRKMPQQQRSQALVAAVLEAAVRILKREGEEALTTRRVAEVAGVSVGSLYQYFPNRDAIVRVLINAHVRGMLTRIDTALGHACSAATPEEVVRLFAGELVAEHTADLERWGLIAEQVLRFGDLDACEEGWHAVIERAHELIRRIAPDFPEAEGARAAERLAFLVRALLVDTLVQRPEDLEDGRLAEDISCLILGYVDRCSATSSASAP